MTPPLPDDGTMMKLFKKLGALIRATTRGSAGRRPRETVDTREMPPEPIDPATSHVPQEQAAAPLQKERVADLLKRKLADGDGDADAGLQQRKKGD